MITKYIVLENDIITIMYNELLKKKPYLIRLVNYDNEQYEIRMDKEDLDSFYNLLQHIRGRKGIDYNK